MVGLSLERRISALVAILAVLKAGGAYVPLDPSLPNRRLRYMIGDSNCRLVLADGGACLDPTELEWRDINDPDLFSGSTADLDLQVSSTDLAYCLYTSGSTGNPKGVLVPHGALLNYVVWAAKQYVSDDIHAFALYSSLAFDLTVTSIFVPLISGARIHVYPEGENEPALYAVLRDNQVDALKLTPAHLALLNATELKDSRLKVLIVGGEQLNAELAQATYRRLGANTELFNEYGPTEATVGCMIYHFDAAADQRGSVPIGRAIDAVDIQVLDDERRPISAGQIGEIYIGGAGLARGYQRRSDLTAATFVPHTARPGERMYATGDLARLDARGNLVFLGRRDLQIKLRGHRIELSEIENTLLQHAQISDCVVVTTRTDSRTENAPRRHCVRCGLASNFPNTEYSAEGVCNHCTGFERYRGVVESYLSEMSQFEPIKAQMQAAGHSKYDCIMAFSGGKDSTYALCRLVDMGLRVLGFTLDNGYISDQAKANIGRVVQRLGIEHRYLTTPHMDQILVDSLRRHSNVCNGCFKTIYSMAISLAQEVGVDHVVTGLSKGQLFETRTSALFRSERFDDATFERDLIDARKLYHRIDDAPNRLLKSTCAVHPELLERIRFVDFYRYCTVSRDEMYAYIEQRVDWLRPGDTGRSTNCLLNDVGIYVHNRERRYHNYSLPYSWDVRLGQLSRDAAVRELDDSEEIDVHRVQAILAKLGYEVNDAEVDSQEAQLVAYYVASENMPEQSLRAFLAEQLPEYMLPSAFVQIDQIPLTPNGKVNRQGLPRVQRRTDDSKRKPTTDIERALAELWQESLKIDDVGLDDDFFQLGGHSLPALMLLFEIDRRFGRLISIDTFSSKPTISALAALLSDRSRGDSSAPALRGKESAHVE